MTPFIVNQFWYEAHWFGRALPHTRPLRAGSRMSARVGKIAAAAALLTATGGGAALAQGSPPGFGPWQSGWPDYLVSHQPRATDARGPAAAQPGGRATVAKNGEPAPVAGNAPATRRKG